MRYEDFGEMRVILQDKSEGVNDSPVLTLRFPKPDPEILAMGNTDYTDFAFMDREGI